MAHPAFFAALFLPFLVYCGQLGQETALGEHAGLLAPATLLFLSFSISSPWVFSLLKLYIVSLYVGAACTKLIASFCQRKAWWSAPTLQAYLFGALCSRPGDSFVDGLARCIIERPPLCMLLAVSGLGLELATPLALVTAPFSILIGSSLIALSPSTLASICSKASTSSRTGRPPSSSSSPTRRRSSISAARRGSAATC